jgi:hypothetical protein
MQIDQPIGAFCSDTEWMLHKPWRVITRLGTLLILPGFKSDGASIPKFLWSIVGPRFAPTTFAAALAHDALYRSGLCSRKDADLIFRDILFALRHHVADRDLPKWFRVVRIIISAIRLNWTLPWIYWVGVRIGGRKSYRARDGIFHKVLLYRLINNQRGDRT